MVQVHVTRQTIDIRDVDSKVYFFPSRWVGSGGKKSSMNDDGVYKVGYLRLLSFSSDAPTELTREIARIQKGTPCVEFASAKQVSCCARLAYPLLASVLYCWYM